MNRVNPEYEKQLEASVRRELDALGELPAPPALANRILRALEARQAAPWYRQSWAEWPLMPQIAVLTVLAVSFGAFCYVAWQVSQGISAPAALTAWWADVSALGRTSAVLANTFASLFSRIGTGFIIAALTLVFASWVACIGLGTLCVRLVLRPAVNRIEL